MYRSRLACSFFSGSPASRRLDGVNLSSFLGFFSVVAVVYLDRRAGDILHRNALTGVLRKAGLFVRDLKIPDEAVVDHHTLGAVLAHALGLVHLDPVDQLGQKILRQHLHFHKPTDRADELVPLVAAVVKVLQNNCIGVNK